MDVLEQVGWVRTIYRGQVVQIDIVNAFGEEKYSVRDLRDDNNMIYGNPFKAITYGMELMNEYAEDEISNIVSAIKRNDLS